jgi:uncharacterized protein YecT (DUF1311 family)
MIALYLTLFLQVSTPALDAAWREHNCTDPQYQSDMNACEEIRFQRTDLELNQVWREVVAGAQRDDRELDRTADTRPTYEAVLRAAQRAWLTYRDQHCTWEAYNQARGGTMEPMAYSACRAVLTRERITQLRALENAQ